MTLRARLTLGLLTIAVILVVPLLFASRSLSGLHTETKKLRDGDFAASLLLGDLRDALNDLRTADMALRRPREPSSRVIPAKPRRFRANRWFPQSLAPKQF
jgi:hypothetical protein